MAQTTVEQCVRDVLAVAIKAGIVHSNVGDIQKAHASLGLADGVLRDWLAKGNPPTEWLSLYLWKQPDKRFGFSGIQPWWEQLIGGNDDRWAVQASRLVGLSGGVAVWRADGTFHQGICRDFISALPGLGPRIAAMPSGESLAIELAAQVRKGD